MNSWYKRMKNKFKNYRWWCILPLILALGVFILLPVKLLQLFGELSKQFGDYLYRKVNYEQKWLSEIVKWSERNEKGKGENKC